MVADGIFDSTGDAMVCHASARPAFHGPRAREFNTLMLARGIGFWFSALGMVDQINQALTLETSWMTRLVGGQA